MLGVALTHWSIRIALLCLAARLGGGLLWRHHAHWFAWSRWLSTVGCLLFLLHVASAFHFYHEWRHEHAFQTTADRTYDMLGIRFGEGIYFSYLFALLWTADVAWQWASPERYRARPVWLSAAVLIYLAFIAFNGAVIFEDGPVRWVGIPVTLALVLVAVITLVRQRRNRTKTL
jgi:hypothetical protein